MSNYDDFETNMAYSDDFEAYVECLEADYDEIERIEAMLVQFEGE